MSSGAAILVIEDELNTRTLMQMTLRQGGYQCLHASTGIAGVASALENVPSAVLLDLGLPDLDGVEVTRRNPRAEQRPNHRRLGARPRERQGRGARQWRQ